MHLPKLEATTYASEQWINSVRRSDHQVQANFNEIESEFNALKAHQDRLDTELLPFIRWINSVYPELPEEFRTATAVAKRIEQDSTYDVMMEAG